MSQCTAKSKRSGERCRRAATPGRTVCRMHGGKSLAGVASPTYKHGRYSKVLPKRLLDALKRALRDTELLELRDEIALIDVRVCDVLTRVDTGESGDGWRAVGAVAADLLAARRSGHAAALDTALERLTELVTGGLEDYAAWREVLDAIDRRRRLTESERRRMVELQEYITAQQAMALMQALVDAVKQNVKDPAALAAVQQTFERLTNSGD